LRPFGVNAGADLLDQRIGFFVKFGGTGQISTYDGVFGIQEFLAQDDGIGLAKHGLIDSRVRRTGLGRHRGGSGQQEN
jgi:hypothetical protein